MATYSTDIILFRSGSRERPHRPLSLLGVLLDNVVLVPGYICGVHSLELLCSGARGAGTSSRSAAAGTRCKFGLILSAARELRDGSA